MAPNVNTGERNWRIWWVFWYKVQLNSILVLNLERKSDPLRAKAPKGIWIHFVLVLYVLGEKKWHHRSFKRKILDVVEERSWFWWKQLEGACLFLFRCSGGVRGDRGSFFRFTALRNKRMSPYHGYAYLILLAPGAYGVLQPCDHAQKCIFIGLFLYLR